MKRIFSILAVLAVAVNMVGCAPSDTAAPVEAAEQVTEETAAETTEAFEMKTIEPPEDGWTTNTLLDVTYVFNEKIVLPCTIDTLKSSFSYDKSSEYTTDEESNTISIILFHENDSAASVVLKDCQIIEDVDSNTVVERLFFADFLSDETNNNVIINGITFDDNKSLVVEKLGIPDNEEKNYIEYYDKESGDTLLQINFDDTNVLSILLILE